MDGFVETASSPRTPTGAPRRRRVTFDQSQRTWQLASAIAAIAYVASLVLVHRPPSGYLTFWDGWVYNISFTLPVVPLFIRARHSSAMRGAWLAIGSGVALYDVGNLVYFLHDENLNPIPSPAWSDLFYLSSYVALAVGITLMTQRSYEARMASRRLDGAVTGLAVGALASLLWFDSLLKLSVTTWSAIVGLSYPVLDLALLILLIAGLAPMRFRLNLTTGLMMVGFAVFIVGDTIYMNKVANGTYVQGTLLDGTWNIGILLLALSAWPDPDRRTRSRDATSMLSLGVILMPLIFGCVAATVIVISAFDRTSRFTILLAASALFTVILLLSLTIREVRQSTVNYLDARTDPLTRLSNRRGFLEDVAGDMGLVKDSGRMALLMIDLDGFKDINDSLGHAAGDRLLEIIATRYKNCLDGRGSIARLGGDEFAVSLLVTSRDEAKRVAEELAEAGSSPISLDGVIVRVTASMGIALYPDDGLTDVELMRSADVAMYQAKKQHGTACFYSIEDDPNSRERLAMVNELRTAIEANELVLHYQPMRDLRSGRVRGVEALVRWNHPTRGLLYPDDFIPLAERTGLINSLSRVVIEMAVACAARLDRCGHSLQMNANISRFDLLDDGLSDFVDEVLAKHEYPGSRLTLEVTETAIGEDPERARRCLEKLRECGIRISVDDFGVGYSSLSRLLGLPIDELKVDKSFILAVEVDVRAQAIAAAAAELGRALGLTLIAEGVETPGALALVQKFGIDVGQGYLFARPLPSDMLDDYLALGRTNDASFTSVDSAPLV